MRPKPFSRMLSMTLRVVLYIEVRLTLMTAFQFSGVSLCSGASRVMPALLTRTSTGPCSATILAMPALVDSKLLTSKIATGIPVLAVNSLALSSFTSLATTLKPASLRAMEIAAPRPRAPPVTNARRAMEFSPRMCMEFRVGRSLRDNLRRRPERLVPAAPQEHVPAAFILGTTGAGNDERALLFNIAAQHFQGLPGSGAEPGRESLSCQVARFRRNKPPVGRWWAT